MALILFVNSIVLFCRGQWPEGAVSLGLCALFDIAAAIREQSKC